MILGFLFILTLFPFHLSQAASCCGGGSALPSLILGDDRHQVSIQTSRSSRVGSSTDQGQLAYSRETHTQHILSIEGATLLSDRWQLGWGLPWNWSDSISGAGDARLAIAYEALPEWTYSTWTPKAHVFSQLGIPIGPSLGGQSDRSHWALSLGSVWTKQREAWDGFVVFEGHYAFPREFELAGAGPTPGNHSTYRVSPGFGGSAALGAGWSPGAGRFRFGLRLQPMLQQDRHIELSSEDIRTEPYQLYWNVALESAYLLWPTASIHATYTDQTLMGPSVRASLNRIFALGFQYRWAR